MARSFAEKGYEVVSQGTDNHLLLIDLSNKGITGQRAEAILDQAGITANKNKVPFDTRSTFVTSGIRVGTSAITTRGMGTTEAAHVVTLIDRALSHAENRAALEAIRQEAYQWMQDFPLPT